MDVVRCNMAGNNIVSESDLIEARDRGARRQHKMLSRAASLRNAKRERRRAEQAAAQAEADRLARRLLRKKKIERPPPPPRGEAVARNGDPPGIMVLLRY